MVMRFPDRPKVLGQAVDYLLKRDVNAQGGDAFDASTTNRVSPSAILEVQNLKFSYSNGAQVLSDVQLTLRPGEIVSIVGPSGCGKSTLLKIVAGLLRPSGGSIQRYRGDTADDRPFLTMMFQEDTLLAWRNVLDNASLYFKYKGTKRTPEARARVAELLSMVGIGDYDHHYPSQLSGGMRRRLAFVTAVVPLPQILLLDEPFSALDEPTRLAIHQDALAVIRQYRMACCLVTHDLAEAITLSDRVIVLTKAPAVIANSMEIDLGDERDVMALREERAYLDIYAELWSYLRAQMETGPKMRKNSR